MFSSNLVDNVLFGVNYFCRSTTIIFAGALAVTPEAPGQLDSLQYRQIQIAYLLEQLRGRGPGEGLRQRVPPLPVLFLGSSAESVGRTEDW